MSSINLYQLNRHKHEQTLITLLTKVIESGAKAVVYFDDKEFMNHIDKALWVFGRGSFLPHGKASDNFEEDQIILLTDVEKNPIGADFLFLFSKNIPEFYQSFARVMDVFDGNDIDSLKSAKIRFKKFRDEKNEVKYFAQDEDGKWIPQ